MTASPSTNAMRARRQTTAVVSHRRASQPEVTSLAASIVTAIATMACGALGNSTAPATDREPRGTSGQRDSGKICSNINCFLIYFELLL